MVNNKHYYTLTDEQVKYLSLFSKECLYSRETQIIYAGQVPTASYLLLAGKITLRDAQKRPVKNCGAKSLFGFSEIYNHRPYKYTVEIEAGSKVIILSRSTILEIQKNFTENIVKQFINFSQLVESA